MERFENKICPICRAPFGEKSDIVVCPQCGTPHHRVCYMVKNRCAFEDKHAEGYVWKGYLPDETVPSDAETLSSSEKADDEKMREELRPIINGMMSDDPAAFESLFGNDETRKFFSDMQNKEIGEDGVSIHELAAYVGSSVWHYGRAFSLFRGTADGKKHFVSFNLFSGLFAPTFQFYRKMDLLGVGVLALMLLPLVISRFVFGNARTSSVMIGNGPAIFLNLISTAVMIVMCLFGDYFYYKHAVSRIKKIRSSYEGDTLSDDYFLTLCEVGNPSFMRGALGCLASALAELCVFVL